VAADVAADRHAADQAQDDDQRPRAPQGPYDLAHVAGLLAHVGADEQDFAAGQPPLQAARRALDPGAVLVGVGDRKAGPGLAAAEVLYGRFLDRAGDLAALRVHQQVEEGPPAD